MQRLSCLVFALAACGGSPKSAEPTMPATTGAGAASATSAAPAAPTCATASDHVIDLLAKAQPDAPPQVVKKIRDTLVAHCEQDGWSAESRTCFMNMQTKEQGDHCEDGLTDAQKQALMKEAGGEAEPDQGEGGTRGAPGGGSRKGGDPCDGGE